MDPRRATGLALATTALISGALAPAAEAATVVAEWIKPSGGAWSDPTAWSTAPIVPDNDGGTTYDVRIPGSFAITLDAQVEVDALDLGRSSYSGTGSLNVLQSLLFRAPQISGLTISNEGIASLEGGVTNLSNATLRNSGTLIAAASGRFSGGTLQGYAARFENTSSGLLRMEGSSPTLDFEFGGSTISNDGSIVQAPGSGTGRISASRIDNSGSIDVQGGTLSFFGGLSNTGAIRGAAGSTIGIFSTSNPNPTPVSSGTIDTSGDLRLSGVRVVGSTRVGGLLSTVGTTEFVSSSGFIGRSLRVENGVTTFRAQGLELDSLVVDYGASLFVEGDVAVSAPFEWRGSLTTNGTLWTSGTQTMGRGFGGRLENSGVLRLVSSSIGGGAVLLNRVGAELQSDGGTRLVGGGQIENFGTHVHTGTVLGNLGEIRLPYANHGLIDVQSGRLSLVGVTGAGEVRVGRDATLGITDATFAPGARVTGEGWISLAGNQAPLLADWDVAGTTNIYGSVEFAGPIRQLPELRIVQGSAIFAQPDLELPRVVFEHPGPNGPPPSLVAHAPLRIRDAIEWRTGSFAGSASIVPAGGITVPIGASSIAIDGVELLSSDRIDFQGSNRLELRNGGRLVNRPSGEVTVGASSSNTIRDAVSLPPGSILNEGTWTNRSTKLELLTQFDNAGRLVNETGELRLGRGRSTGAIEVGAGSRVIVDYDYVIDPSSSVTGDGAIELRGSQTIGAGYRMTGPTSFGFRLTLTGDAQLGSSVTGNTLEVLARTHAPHVSASTIVVADGGELAANDLQASTLELWDGTLRSFDPDPIRVRELRGRGTTVGDVELAGFVSPGVPPRIPPRRVAARIAPGGGSRGTSAMGELQIDGDLALSVADLVIELAGLERGITHDALRVSGGVELGLDALLQVSVLDDFADRISAGDAFEILHAEAGIAGQFANAPFGGRVSTRAGTGSFQVDLVSGSGGSTSLVLRDYRPVPEPGSALLIAIGLATLSESSRSRARRTRASRDH